MLRSDTQKSAKKVTNYSGKIAYTSTTLDLNACHECAGFGANVKVRTNEEMVVNHWSSEPWSSTIPSRCQ